VGTVSRFLGRGRRRDVVGGRAAAVAPGGSSPGALARSAQGSPFSLLLLASPSLPHPCAFLHGCWNPSCACLGVSENHSETERQGEASGRLCGPCSAGRGRGPMTSPPAASWLCPAGAPAMVSSQNFGNFLHALPNVPDLYLAAAF
uniref:Uncharacterized protein n=1 Tax=Mustela putorius furo TaxID=9669 RepID=M3YVY8_MUSPF